MPCGRGRFVQAACQPRFVDYIVQYQRYGCRARDGHAHSLGRAIFSSLSSPVRSPPVASDAGTDEGLSYNGGTRPKNGLPRYFLMHPFFLKGIFTL